MLDPATASALASALEQAKSMDAPLARRLDHFADELRRLHPRFAQAVDRLVERLQRVGAGSGAPTVGDPMPPFLLPDEEGRLTSLDEIVADGPAAIAFHRGHWCPYCQLNMLSLAAVARRIDGVARIVAISPEVQSYTRRHKDGAGARFPILSDAGQGLAAALGLVIWIGEEMQAVMTEIGRDLPAYQGTGGWLLPIPATFVVSRDGIIRARFVDADFRRRMDADALIEALTAAAAVETTNPPTGAGAAASPPVHGGGAPRRRRRRPSA